MSWITCPYNLKLTHAGNSGPIPFLGTKPGILTLPHVGPRNRGSRRIVLHGAPRGSPRRFQGGKGSRSLASRARHSHSCLGSGLKLPVACHASLDLSTAVSSTLRRSYRCFCYWRRLSSKSEKLWRETDLHSKSGSAPC